jgi:hypothetical protein
MIYQSVDRLHKDNSSSSKTICIILLFGFATPTISDITMDSKYGATPIFLKLSLNQVQWFDTCSLSIATYVNQLMIISDPQFTGLHEGPVTGYFAGKCTIFVFI